jgi:nicotinamidase-related amidase
MGPLGGRVPLDKTDTTSIYARARLGQRLKVGTRPGILVVDFSLGFTDASSPLGSQLDSEVLATRRLLDAAREKGLPIVFTSVAYEANGKDLGLWAQKAPAMLDLTIGSHWVELDPRLDAQPEDSILIKKGASAFFGTNLATILTCQHVDTLILCGATTSGCVRASAVDALQFGFPTLVPEECVGDRARGPHTASLFDMNAKYADVLPLEDVLSYVASVPDRTVTSADPTEHDQV